MEQWYKVLNDPLNFSVLTKVTPTKGNLVYEYNPLRNYRLSENKYLFQGFYYTEEELNNKFDIEIDKREIINESDNPGYLKQWIDSKNKQPLDPTIEPPILYSKGQLVDFDTDELKVSINHPITIIPQYSYDGSVNLILNDGINIPRLINTRFSATGKNSYEVVDRKGNNDTNIYDQGEQFDIDTSLYKRVIKIPEINFVNVQAGGNLKVGNYHFYFKFSDADGNETDFVGESGLVSIFIGHQSPRAIHTGQKNENSTKSVKFVLSNVDTSYDYVHVYYSRDSAEGNNLSITEYAKIEKRYLVNSSAEATILITGFEETTELTQADINLFYLTVDAAQASATCQNMLFMGNIHKPDIPYNKLQDLSLRFLPYVKEESYNLNMNEQYRINSTEKGYYDPKFIYNKVGYWGNEFYRVGIVYIMPNNELTPVFNIRGRYKVKPFTQIPDSEFSKLGQFNDGQYNHYKLYNESEYNSIKVKEETNFVIDPTSAEGLTAINKSFYENVKGVFTLDPTLDTNTIYSLDIRTDDDTIQELKKYVKGYFFVRQKRIPTILAQGVTIGVDKESHTPTIPTMGGFLQELAPSLNNTYVETDDINDVNYISEGFLSRYSYNLVPKSSSIWSKLGRIMLTAMAVTVSVVGIAVLFPPVAPIVGKVAVGIGLKSSVGFLAAVATTALAGASAGIGAGVVGAIAGGVDEAVNVIKRTTQSIKLEGKHTKIPSGMKRKEDKSSRQLSTNFYDRVIIKDEKSNKVQAVICPDYEVNQAKYVSIFTGNEHILRSTLSQSINGLAGYKTAYFSNNNNHFYTPAYIDYPSQTEYSCKVISVGDNKKLVGLEDLKFRSRAGEPGDADEFEYVSNNYKSNFFKVNKEEDKETTNNKQINSDIIRGSFGAYLGIDGYPNAPCTTVEILIPGYSESNIGEYINIRMTDYSEYAAISNRYDIAKSDKNLINALSNIVSNQKRSDGYSWNLYRGDCYLCQFTHRLNRNFNDPSAPYNDKIVDVNTWKENYDINDSSKKSNINIGDLNAVQLGMWVTFRIRSSNNLNIRTLDGSNIEETAMTGHPRGYYPYYEMVTEGAYKTPDSETFNNGFNTTLSKRVNFETPDVPHLKNWFGTRIIYSDIHVNDAFRNGYRIFQGNHYRDYTREYGEIVKLVPMESNLLCVFEHGVALIPINERAIAGEGTGGKIYINTSNVLPENPRIISDMFGSQWPESILKVPGKSGNNIQYVYGVDTVAKKIWRTDGITLQCISDFKVQEFLNNNISLGERELTPCIGIRNVKTCYNAFKQDVLFTFYDNTYGFEEKVWNLCWNELLQKFITFYSWVPSYMENINNVPFSFNRDVSKWIAKLGASHNESSIADGITLTNNVINDRFTSITTPSGDKIDHIMVDNFKSPITYINNKGTLSTIYAPLLDKDKEKFIGVLGLRNRFLPTENIPYNIKFSLENDPYNNKDLFIIKNLSFINKSGKITTRLGDLVTDAKYPNMQIIKQGLYYNVNEQYYPKSLYSEFYYRNKSLKKYADYEINKIKWNELIASEVNILDLNTYKVYLEQNPQYPVFTETIHGIYSKCNFTIKELEQNINEPSFPWNNYAVPKNIDYILANSKFDWPIYKDITGKRPYLDRQDQLNPERIVTLLNIKAKITIEQADDLSTSAEDVYYNMKANYEPGTNLVDLGQYESVIALTPKHNMQYLTSDFWKHGAAGIIDIADDIYPTYWYGKQHPFEFECIVVNDPSVHKIFSNLEIISNKAQPESFHYEVIGESYDFAKDKPNIYFRQEAMKALWQYNGADINYNRNFLKVQTKQQPKSADLIHTYYSRQDTFNEIEDYYVHINYPNRYNYSHLSGGEIVYYPNRQEFRIQNHAQAINLNDLNQGDARSLIAANCQYLEDRWKVQINPLLVCYKNEYTRKQPGPLIQYNNSTWADSGQGNYHLPTLPIYNSPIPTQILKKAQIQIPHDNEGRTNALYNLYKNPLDWKWLDTSNWLNDAPTSFGLAQNRKELDLKDRFLKVRIRYSGKELAVIDYLNTLYRVSYA